MKQKRYNYEDLSESAKSKAMNFINKKALSIAYRKGGYKGYMQLVDVEVYKLLSVTYFNKEGKELK